LLKTYNLYFVGEFRKNVGFACGYVDNFRKNVGESVSFVGEFRKNVGFGGG